MAWRGDRMAKSVSRAYRTDRVQVGERLANDAAGKRRGRSVWLARPYDNGRQADGTAIDKSLAGVVVDQ